MKLDLIICDIDGTIADCRHRQHLAGDWDAFHETMMQDDLYEMVFEVIMSLMQDTGAELIFLTGRPERFRAETTTWLEERCALFEDDDYIALLMRPKDDFRPDVEMKPAVLKDWIDNIDPDLDVRMTMDLLKERALFLDDRDKVVAMWRDMGYTCFQTAEGAF